MMYRTLRIFALSLAITVANHAHADDLFASHPLSKARAIATESDKVLLVYVTTQYASKHMDRTTWENPVLRKWIDENAVAAKVDLYSDREAAELLLVHDAPATILYRGAKPIYHRTGYSTAEEVLRAVGADEAADEAEVIHREQHKWKIDDSKPIDLYDVSMQINNLIREEDYETALGGYVWLWMHGQSHRDHPGGRSTYLRSYELHELTSVYPPAMRQFRLYRNKIENKLAQRTASFSDLDDWILLNDAVDEQERTIAWIIRIKDDDDFASTFHRTGYEIQRLLTERNMWSLLGEIHPNPAASARDDLRPYIQQRLQQEQQGDAPDGAVHPLAGFGLVDLDMLDFETTQHGDMYAACLAAGRIDEARKIEHLFHQLDRDGSLHILLTRRALFVGVVNERHLKMVDQAKQMGTDRPDLRMLVERALQPDDNAVEFPA